MDAKDDFRNVLLIVKVCKFKDKCLLMLISLYPFRLKIRTYFWHPDISNKIEKIVDIIRLLVPMFCLLNWW